MTAVRNALLSRAPLLNHCAPPFYAEQGGFKNNKFHGFGVYLWADGAKYEGTWLQSK